MGVKDGPRLEKGAPAYKRNKGAEKGASVVSSDARERGDERGGWRGACLGGCHNFSILPSFPLK